MAVIRFSNNASTTLLSGINASATEFTVASGTGELFPSINPVKDESFICTIIDSTGKFEIVRVTARVGDRMTCVRGMENTSATSFAAGSIVELRLTADGLNWLSGRVGNIESTFGFSEDGTVFNPSSSLVSKIVAHTNFKHASKHATSGSDPITPVSIGAAKGDASGNAINSNKWGGSALFRSTSAPGASAGAVNDIWFQYFA